MSLINRIERLRGKSDSVKNSVALAVSIMFTVLVIMVWLSFAFISNRAEDNTATLVNTKDNTKSPITIIKGMF